MGGEPVTLQTAEAEPAELDAAEAAAGENTRSTATVEPDGVAIDPGGGPGREVAGTDGDRRSESDEPAEVVSEFPGDSESAVEVLGREADMRRAS
jgi:hypothetical protein